MLVLDGAIGEGGGQVLRSVLTLAMVTRRPFRMERIRAGREKPGLQHPHLVALRAAASICNAEVVGAELGSTVVSFRPRAIQGGEHHFVTPDAASITLVLQTIAPALWRAPKPSVVTLEGGTHVPMAPPFDFVERSWAPAMRSMGASIQVELQRPGFYPKGGGLLLARFAPSALGRFERESRGPEKVRRARCMIAGLSEAIAERELRVARERLGVARDRLVREPFDDAHGPGNAFVIDFEHEHGTSVFSSFGERGLRAEQVAEIACGQALAFHESDAAVDERLADQLLVPMAIGKGGLFTTTEPSSHCNTQIEIIHRFLDVDVDVTTRDERTYTVELRGADV